MVMIRAGAALVEVRAPNPEVVTQLTGLWARCLSGGIPDAEIRLPDSALPLSPELDYRLASEVVLRAIEHGAGRSVMLHAAAVTDPAGRALVLVADSGVGKTTAALTLCRRGYGYLTDELAVLDGPDVLALPKPLCLVDGRSETKLLRGPDELGLGEAPPRARVGGFVILARNPSHAGEPALAPLAGIEALQALLPHACALPSLPAPLEGLALLGHVPIVRVTYAEADDLVGALARLDGLTAGVREWDALASGPADGEGWRRAPGVTGVRVGDRGLLLAGDVPVELGPLGVTLWEGMEHGLTLDAAAALCVAAHGPFPHARDAVATALGRLADARAILAP